MYEKFPNPPSDCNCRQLHSFKNTNSSSVVRKEESLQLGNYLSRRRDKNRRFLREAIICLIQTNFSTSYSTRSHHIPEYLFLLFQDRQFCPPRNKRQTRLILMLYICGRIWVILMKRLFWLVKQILIIFVIIGKIQFWLLVGLCPRVRGDDKGNFGKWASCSLALPPNDLHEANKQANKGDKQTF